MSRVFRKFHKARKDVELHAGKKKKGGAPVAPPEPPVEPDEKEEKFKKGKVKKEKK